MKSKDVLRILLIVGTRPEAVKLLPLWMILVGDKRFDVHLVTTGQQTELVKHVFGPFHVHPDIELCLMDPTQTLNDLTSRAINALADVYKKMCPEVVVIQGDTTSAFCAALAAFQHTPRINVAHVEAGLRTYDRLSPYPEEANRKMIAALADYHFPPTTKDAKHLYREGIERDQVVVTGNTVIDALQLVIDQKDTSKEFDLPSDRHSVLITLHRRESWAFEDKQANRTVMEGMLAALHNVATCFKDIQFIFRKHPNPKVYEPAMRELGHVQNIRFIEPIPSYLTFVKLLSRMRLIVTDSGGIQEEAPALGVPVLVLREKTERIDALFMEGCQIVGTSEKEIQARLMETLTKLQRIPPAPICPMKLCLTPIGDGKSAERIRDSLLHFMRGDQSRSLKKA